jgi:hypothetical protein
MQDHRSLADQANGDARSRRVGVTSSFRPPQATLQSLPPKPWSFALIWREPKYTVWRPPAFAGFCHRARQPADRNAYSRTPTQLRKLGKKHAALPLPSRSIILDFCRCSCDKNAQMAIVQERPLCAAGARDQADSDAGGSRLTSGCIRTRRGEGVGCSQFVAAGYSSAQPWK